MQTLYQITNKKQLKEKLEEIILDFCNDVLNLKLTVLSFKYDLKSHTDENLKVYNLNEKKFTPLEGTFLFHSVFSKTMPQVYVQWYELEHQSMDDENFFVENEDKNVALAEAMKFYKEWQVELSEPLLIQELKPAVQYRLFEMRESLSLILLNDCDILHFDATEDKKVSEELLELLNDIDKTERQLSDLISKIEFISN